MQSLQLPLLSSLLALLSSAHLYADSVNAIVFLNEGTPVFSNQTTTGTPLSFSKTGAYGSTSVSASLGLVQLDLDSVGDFSNSAFANGGGGWDEFYTINGGVGLAG